MRKKSPKLRISSETLRNLDLDGMRGVAGGDIETLDVQNTGGGGTGGSITCSVPFCNTLYPNTCASIGC